MNIHKNARTTPRSRPGELVHLDTKKLAWIAQPSHRVTGNRRDVTQGVGWEYAHVAIDDCTRYTYVEILPDQKRYTATAFWLRAVRAFRQRGIHVQRMLTDNAGIYRSRPYGVGEGDERTPHLRVSRTKSQRNNVLRACLQWRPDPGVHVVDQRDVGTHLPERQTNCDQKATVTD